MNDFETMDLVFDDWLIQTIKYGLSHEELEKGVRVGEFEQVAEWKLKFGYKFNIYGKDHFIDGKPHFHFDNRETGVFSKIDFEGNVLESSGSIPSKILKELAYFIRQEPIMKKMKAKWNEKNPTLVVS